MRAIQSKVTYQIRFALYRARHILSVTSKCSENAVKTQRKRKDERPARQDARQGERRPRPTDPNAEENAPPTGHKKRGVCDTPPESPFPFTTPPEYHSDRRTEVKERFSVERYDVGKSFVLNIMEILNPKKIR